MPESAGLDVPLFRRGRWYTSEDLTDIGSRGDIRVSLAPPIMIKADQRPRSSVAPVHADPATVRDILLDAVHRFCYGTVQVGPHRTQTYDEFARAMDDLCGLPASLVDRWSELLRHQVHDVATPRPEDVSERVTRGAVNLPANTFVCLDAVASLLTRHGHVAIRPSRREPVSALRFVGSLLDAGLPADELSLYPTTTDGFDALATASDENIVYGGPAVAQRYADAGSACTVHGPGRACGEIASDVTDEGFDGVLDLIAGDSGRFCRNIRTLIVPSDAASWAERVAAALDAISLEPVDARRPQAHFAQRRDALELREAVVSRLGEDTTVMTTRDLLVESSATYLAPTCLLVEGPSPTDHLTTPLLNFEVPFPFVSVVQRNSVRIDTLRERSGFWYEISENQWRIQS